MLVVFIKSLITFIIVLIVIRIMGKRQIGEMQPFELVITLIIAEVACIPMNDPFIPFYNSIVPIVTLAVLQITMSFIARKSMTARKLFSGRSVIAIDKNGINYENLKKMNMNVNDLIEAVRASGYADLSLIEYAIFETNGKICVVEKAGDSALLPIAIMIDGKWENDNMALSGAAPGEIIKILNVRGIHKVKDVLYIDIRQDGTVYVSPKYSPCFTAKIKISGGNNW